MNQRQTDGSELVKSFVAAAEDWRRLERARQIYLKIGPKGPLDPDRCLDVLKVRAAQTEAVQEALQRVETASVAVASLVRQAGRDEAVVHELVASLRDGYWSSDLWHRAQAVATASVVGKCVEEVGSGLTLNERMQQAIYDDPRRAPWEASGWAELLGCAVDSVYKLGVWKALRAADQDERRMRQERIIGPD